MSLVSRDLMEYGTCPVCGQVSLPILEMLPCGHDVEPIRALLDSPGIIYSWTRSRIGPVVVLMVMADFFGGTLRVTAPLEAEETPQFGRMVKLVRGLHSPYAFLPND
jgi:uncharacterized OB-fold protein